MIEIFLSQISDDAPNMLMNFILEKEQELQGKLYVQLSYKQLSKANSQKQVVVTIFCQRPENTSPLVDYNNVLIKTLLERFQSHIPVAFKAFLAMVDVQKKLNKAFGKLEEKHNGSVRIVIYNKKTDDKIETVFKEIYPNSEKENSFEGFLGCGLKCMI